MSLARCCAGRLQGVLFPPLKAAALLCRCFGDCPFLITRRGCVGSIPAGGAGPLSGAGACYRSCAAWIVAFRSGGNVGFVGCCAH